MRIGTKQCVVCVALCYPAWALAQDITQKDMDELSGMGLAYPQVSDEEYSKLLEVASKVFTAFRSMSGGETFEAARGAIEITNINRHHQCEKTIQELPDYPQDHQRAQLIRAMLPHLEELQTAGPTEVGRRLLMRHQGTRLEAHMREDPRLVRTMSRVLTTPGIMDCALVSILDTQRLVKYAAFYGLLFVGIAGFGLIAGPQSLAVMRVMAPALVSPVLMALTLFIFYLFFAPEIDPVMEIVKQEYRM